MSVNERLARHISQGTEPGKPHQPKHNRGIIAQEAEEAAEFFKNPPHAIFIPDCYIPNNPQKAEVFMEVRCSIAVNVFQDPHLYGNLENRPVVMVFANNHVDHESAGSEKVAGLLIDRGVPPGKIIASKTTITGSGDTTQLHAIYKTRDISGPLVDSPLMIAVDNHYARRVRQLLINHKRDHKDFYGVKVYIIHPSHPVMGQLTFSPSTSPKAKAQIEKDLILGQSGKLTHGWRENAAWALSAIPILRPLQQRTEEMGHVDMRQREQSRYVAKKMKDAAKRLRFYRNVLMEKYPYRSKDRSKIAPDENSAMALAPGLYTRVKDRGGPNDKEINIKRATAAIQKYPDIPAHG